ncbi:hypothetical protein [Stutzerimonas zhaodongensis]|uniref:hypothetical protein n=1 Tax=Stutzerimonas zhaodongensis TaxID=1176257 RepID=UPI001F4DD233|nr:hypothetical protein [Stutzerimonas zhaodongensis]UNG18468.1 hypothetical protein MKP10_22290 [Stutzerimonas zhaodongensis]
MKVVRDPRQLTSFPPSLVKRLLKQHLINLSQNEPYDPDVHGFFVVAERGDDIDQIERVSGCALRESWFEDCFFGDEGFIPRWEWLEYHADRNGGASCYEIVFILNDSGFGAVIIVPDEPGIDPVLLSLCRSFVLPS